MKKIVTLTMLLSISAIVIKAQTNVSIGAGTTIPNSAFKTTNNTGNLTTFKINAYLPVWHYGGASGGVVNYGGATGGVISFGFNAGGEYLTGNSAYDINSYKPFNITGQTGIPPIVARGTGSPKAAGFKTEGGAQANFSFGSYTISPIINLAYINLKQKAFTVVQNSSVNGQNYEHTLYSQAETKTSGVAFVPKLVHRYKFGRDNRFSVFVETNYMFGPNVKTNATTLTPEGTANAQGNYNINQLNAGTRTPFTKTNKFSGFGINAGIGFSFATKKGSNKSQKNNEAGEPQNKPKKPKSTTVGMKVNIQDLGLTKQIAPDSLPSTTTNTPEASQRKAALKKAKKPSKPNNNETIITDSTINNADPQERAALRKARKASRNETIDKQINPRLKCNCGTDIYGKDEAACKRICQFLKDGTYSSLSLNPNVKNDENITVKSQILTMPNQMGIGWQPLAQIISSNKKVTYSDLTADEAKKIDQLPITYLLPSKVTLATTNINNLGQQNNQFDWYWKVYKNNKGAFVAVPMPLMMSEDGLKNLGAAMRKSNGSSSGATEQAPCKFIYRSLPVDMIYMTDIGMDDVYLSSRCRGTNLVFAPHGDATAMADLPNMPSKMVYDADGTTMRISANAASKAQTLKEAKFSSTYIDGYGMVVYPMDYGISNAEASVLVNGLFRGSKKIEVANKSSEGNTIKYFGEQSFSANITTNTSNSEGCISEAYKNWAYTNSSNLDVNHRIMILTPQNSMQGLVPVFLNPTTLDCQLMGYVAGHDLSFRIDAILPTTWMPILGSTFYSTSTTSMTKSINISSLPAGKYSIYATDLWPEESKRANMCSPYFIVAKTLVNATKLPSCVYSGQTIPITWSGGNGATNVNLIVRRINSVTASVPINITVPNTGSYNLVIPNTGFTVGEAYDVEINDGNQYVRTTYYNQANAFKFCKKQIDKGTLTKSPISSQPTGTLSATMLCDCGTWQYKKIKVDDQIKDITCNGAINLKNNTNAFFNLKYNGSSASCIIKYEVTVTKPNGSASTIVITNNTNWSYLFNSIGNYSLTFKTYSNDILCPDSCKYTVVVN